MKPLSLSFFIFFLLLSLIGNSQKRDKKIDSLIYEITINLASSNSLRAHYLADSLFLYAPSSHEKLRALLVTAEVYKIEGKTAEMLETLLTTLEYSKNEKDYTILSKTYGYLSTLCRQIGFFEEGKHYLEKAIAIISKTEDPATIEAFKAMANSEIAEFEMEMSNFSEAIRYLDIAKIYYIKNKENQRAQFLISRLEEVRGRCYMGLNNPEKALNSFRTSKRYLEASGSEHSLFTALIYQGLGEVFLATKQLDSSEYYLKQALTITQSSTYDPLKEELYGSLVNYYNTVGLADSASFFSHKFREISKINSQSNKMMVNNLIQSLPSRNSFLVDKSNRHWWILSGGILFIFGGVLFLANPSIRSKIILRDRNVHESKDIKLSEEIENKFEERLKTFENSQKFLDPNMSLATLISYLDTNAKYLNHFLKISRQKDYNTYINDLRIHYIVQRIDNNKKYRKYKISHLAKESGFSSHSNFSANFKRVMDLSPSDYLDKIKSEL